MNLFLRGKGCGGHAGGGVFVNISVPGRWALVPMVLFLTILLVPGAWAVSFSTDIDIDGRVTFDTGSYEDGSVSQSGDMTVTSGGSDTTSTYAGDAVTSGSNPVEGGITDIGDGVGGTGTVSGTTDSESEVGLDMLLSIENTSLTDTYQITFRVDLTTNFVDADGGDAFAESEFTVDDDGVEVFFSHLVSDTLFGDERWLTGVAPPGDLPSNGAALSENNHVFLFDLVVDPGILTDVTAQWTGSSEVGLPGVTANLTFDGFVSVYEVENLTNPPGPAPVPEPGTFLLIGMGLLGVGLVGRRRKAA